MGDDIDICNTTNYYKQQIDQTLISQKEQIAMEVDALRNKLAAECEEKLRWYWQELQHYKDRCRELEMELVLATGDFESTADINLDVFEGRNVFNYE